MARSNKILLSKEAEDNIGNEGLDLIRALDFFEEQNYKELSSLLLSTQYPQVKKFVWSKIALTDNLMAARFLLKKNIDCPSSVRRDNFSPLMNNLLHEGGATPEKIEELIKSQNFLSALTLWCDQKVDITPASKNILLAFFVGSWFDRVSQSQWRSDPHQKTDEYFLEFYDPNKSVQEKIKDLVDLGVFDKVASLIQENIDEHYESPHEKDQKVFAEDRLSFLVLTAKTVGLGFNGQKRKI